MLWRNGVEGSVNRTLKLRPEAFDGIGVNLATNVLTFPVADRFVQMPKRLNLVVTVGFIGGDDGTGLNHALQERHERNLFTVRNRLGFDSALALDHAENRSLSSSASSTLTATPNAANVSFVGFHHIIPAKRIGILAHKLANLLCDAPSTLIGHSKMPLQLLGGDTVLALTHQENGVEPKCERCRTLVEDCAFGWIGLEATTTRIRAAVLDGVAHVSSAFRAFQAVRVSFFENVGETGSVIGEIIMEILNRVLHSCRIPKWLLVVKG